MSKLVYLAGPITGLSYQGSTEWRDFAITELAKHGITGLSPMRGKEYLATLDELMTADGNRYQKFGTLSTNRGIMTRDHWDATRCDVLLVNLLGAKKISIGTVMEIAWAWGNHIPVVCVMEEGNIHEHGMILEAIGFRVATLEEALHVTIAILR